ncbi:MAG: hypothetical protein Q9199_000559 [Rusavskia elegans]
MATNRLSYCTVGAVVAFLISISLLSRHLSFLQPLFLQISQTPLKDQSSKYLGSGLSLDELETAFNINTADDFGGITAHFGPRSHPINSTSSGHRLVKRVEVLSYAYAVCKGRLLWADIQSAFNGQRPPGSQFGQIEFDEAWALNPEPNQGLPAGGHWDDAFRSFAYNQVPGPQFILRRVAVQSKTFKNIAGRQVVTPTGGRHDILYVPGWSAMIATNVQSPSARLADNDDSPYGHAVDEKDIPTLIPPMHRLSDISWYVWTQVAPNPGLLRYIGHDFIVTGDTTSIMEYLIIARFGDDEIDLPWPGLWYDIDTDEAKALLVVPNSLATAYIMLDHAATLGRRRPRVHIFKNHRGVWCMLWDLVPV